MQHFSSTTETSNGDKPRVEMKDQVTSHHNINYLLRSSRRIVVISGAGISVNAGIPSARMLGRTSFDSSLYGSLDGTIQFHSKISKIFEHSCSDSAIPTAFHTLLDEIAHDRRLLRHYTQNIDCMERQLPDLETKTVRLHGRVDQARCPICMHKCEFKPSLFHGTGPLCQVCVERGDARTSLGKRSLPIGTLRPNVVLSGDHNPDEEEILEAMNQDLRAFPDMVVVVGTKLGISDTESAAASFCRTTRSRGGVTVWISKDAPSSRSRSLYDYVLKEDCDEIARSYTRMVLPATFRPESRPAYEQDSHLLLAPSAASSASATYSSTHRLTASQLGVYDDILTDVLVDRIYYWSTIRKNCYTYIPIDNDEKHIISILREVVIKEKNPAQAVSRILELPGLKRFSHSLKSDLARRDFRRHVRKYVNIYLPDCPFEISSTNRYTIINSEAAIIARQRIIEGEEIKYLCGIRAVLMEEEETNLREQGLNFSIMTTSRYPTPSSMLGPARFTNADCEANARLETTGSSGVKIIATKVIEIGKEITVPYDKNFFGKNNRECLCQTCEDKLQNGWKQEDQIGTLEPSAKTQFHHHRLRQRGAASISLLSRPDITLGRPQSMLKRKREPFHPLLTESSKNLASLDSVCTKPQSRQDMSEHKRMPATKKGNQFLSIRVPGDYLRADSLVGPPDLTNRETQTNVSFLRHERHSQLYGYRWPQTGCRRSWKEQIRFREEFERV